MRGRWPGHSAASDSRRVLAAWVATSRACASSCSPAPSPCTRSTRSSHGNESPCPTSVTTMTHTVRKSSRSRSGNVKGSDSAAASETTPRMPAHEITTSSRQAVRLSRNGRRGWASQSVTNTQTKRTSNTLPQTSTARMTRPSGGRPASRVTSPGSCRPISTNTSPLSRNTTVSQTARPCRRVSASMSVDD